MLCFLFFLNKFQGLQHQPLSLSDWNGSIKDSGSLNLSYSALIG